MEAGLGSGFGSFFCGQPSLINDVLKTMKEIPKESRAQLDKMERDLGEVK